MWKTQEHMQQHILRLRRKMFSHFAQTGKLHWQLECKNSQQTHINHKNRQRLWDKRPYTFPPHTCATEMCVCVMHRASWVNSGPEHTETAVVLKRTWLETHCQIITLPHTHTQSLSLTYTTHKIPQVHHTNTNLDSCQATLYEDMVKSFFCRNLSEISICIG